MTQIELFSKTSDFNSAKTTNKKHFTVCISSKGFFYFVAVFIVSLISSECSLRLPLWSRSMIIQIRVYVCMYSLKVLLEHFQDVHK